jgi:hypothetical protein
MHDQSQFVDAFRNFGFEVEATPRLREVSGAWEAYNLAREIVEQTRKEGFDGLLIGGRTDLMIYLAIQAPAYGLKLYQAETKRERDENDRFIFNITDITRIYVSHPVDLVGAAIAAEIDTLRLLRGEV